MSDQCVVDEYSIVVVDEDPYLMLVGKCVKKNNDAGGSQVIEATDEADCQAKCTANPDCKAMQITKDDNKYASCTHYTVEVEGD